jgi:hypothetical protein
MANLTSFQADVRPLFTERDIHAMSRAFNLANYDDVKAHAAAIYDRIRGIGGAIMPPLRREEKVPGRNPRLSSSRNGWRTGTSPEKEGQHAEWSHQSAELKFVVTNTLIVRDINRSVAFYRDVLGPRCCVRESRRFFGSATSG